MLSLVRATQALNLVRILARVGSDLTTAADPILPELRGTLFLEDGTRFDGAGTGAEGHRVGEVVFTTGMVGYPESLTDPSFRGQILVFTYPLLGNYGVPDPAARDRWGLPAYFESLEVQVRGVVLRGLTRPSHWRSNRSFASWLREEKVPGVVGIDTRRLTEHLRSHGVLRGVIWVRTADAKAPTTAQLRRELARAPAYAEEKFLPEVAAREATFYSLERGPVVAVPDCGVKASILRALLDRRLSVLRLPPEQTIPEKWEGRRVVGLVVGNGPGDPAELTGPIDALRDARHSGLPTLGICLGQQLLALSRGGKTFKMKYGHRGQNKTVLFTDGRAIIASENHGYAVDPRSLRRTGLKAWASNPDDSTLEGLRDGRGLVLALQGHPEGHPGPQEAGFVFDQFARKLRRRAG
ncbi:MAG: glutamine-hydrolyzing carbamoyl-phosphate synthase small subunit [Thermoplasmata archaeon]|nr:glutamine-hydrolyzing carbamoyl-phosphate synthase small subunit [Thermoplasmata archaeon]